jgi:hypothetical protein
MVFGIIFRTEIFQDLFDQNLPIDCLKNFKLVIEHHLYLEIKFKGPSENIEKKMKWSIRGYASEGG